MHRTLRALLIANIFILITTLTAQAQQPKLSGAEKKADTYVSYQDFAKAEEEYKAILGKKKIDPAEKDRVSIKLANVYYSTRSYEMAENYFEKAAHNLGAFTPEQVAAFLTTLIRNDKNERAIEIADRLTKQHPFSSDKAILNLAEGAKYWGNNPDTSSVAVTKAPFNQPGSTFWCTRYEDGIMFIHIGSDEKAMIKGAEFYYFDGRNSQLYTNIPQTMQAGPATFSRDSSTMIYTDNRFRDNKMVRSMKDQKIITNSLRLMELKYNEKKQTWENAKELFKNKNENSICHPALSDDGQHLYFSADFSDSRGGSDLYMSRKNAKGAWDTPVNLGSVINTVGEELYPNVYDNILCFTSNGHDGFGGMDIYSVMLDEEGLPIGGTLEHMPYPINTVYNDYAYMYDKATGGYFSSDRPNGNDLDAIYVWAKRVTPKVEVKKEQPKPVLAPVKPTIERPAQLAQVREIVPEDVAKDLIAGRTTPDTTVYYGFNSRTLSKEALAIIDAFIESLDGDTPRILVLGYADAIGSSDSNQELSHRRAEVVKEYLAKNGYPDDAIEVIGKGQLQLDEEEQVNDAKDLKAKLAPARKAEIKILE
ncbi:MAG: OmpA family protein [Prevotellaceae bacterium]|jgi:outer membrane protein OmpA-like peptidoglycan-associated protein/tetratricopeptide (TPR) repeat protein|nr:OmpA family protein [Prevotellaceae bacterium]